MTLPPPPFTKYILLMMDDMVLLMIMTMIMKMRMRKMKNIDKPTFFIHQFDDNENYDDIDDENETKIISRRSTLNNCLGRLPRRPLPRLAAVLMSFLR